MLELSDREFKTNLTNMLRALMDNIDSMQKQMSMKHSPELTILGTIGCTLTNLNEKKLHNVCFQATVDLNLKLITQS